MSKPGDSYRDLIRDLLIAAGYKNVTTEALVGGKAVDIYAEREAEFSVRRYVFEAKDYAGTLPLGRVTAFINDYARLARNGSVEQAVLISRTSLTPDGKTAIRSEEPYAVQLTTEEFQRRLFGPTQYLEKLVKEHKEAAIDEFYIPARTAEGKLDDAVFRWLQVSNAMPLVVLGGYGTGKSTYAMHLTNELAVRALSDPTARIPIRITLGNLVQQNNLEGLFGEHFTVRYTVVSPAWHLLTALNKQGRFVIIFDGFDEMKHGMTFHDFERQFELLLSMATGRAKVIILGRDTAIRNDREFKAIIHGQKTTASGTEYTDTRRPSCNYVTLQHFSVEEAREFVQRYSTYLRTHESVKLDNERHKSRVKRLLSNKFDELIVRPVHAQMLCRLATDGDRDFSSIDEFSLYDAFIDYLIRREIEKPGRYQKFTLATRRQANAALSWWLLANSGTSNTTLREAPASLFTEMVSGTLHNFTEMELVAELSAGCLISKGIDTIYFGHRSIQEFLAAQYLHETQYEPRGGKSHYVSEICDAATDKVVDYLGDLFGRSANANEVADNALGQLAGFPGPVRLNHLGPYVAAVGAASRTALRDRSAAVVWCQWIAAHGSADKRLDANMVTQLAGLIRRAQGSEELSGPAYLLALSSFQLKPEDVTFDPTDLIVALLDIDVFGPLIEEARKSGRAEAYSDKFRSYVFSEVVYAHRTGGEIAVRLDSAKLGRIALSSLKTKPLLETVPHFERTAGAGYLEITRQHFLNSVTSGLPEGHRRRARELLAWYLDPANQTRIRGVVVAERVRPRNRTISG